MSSRVSVLWFGDYNCVARSTYDTAKAQGFEER